MTSFSWIAVHCHKFAETILADPVCRPCGLSLGQRAAHLTKFEFWGSSIVCTHFSFIHPVFLGVRSIVVGMFVCLCLPVTRRLGDV